MLEDIFRKKHLLHVAAIKDNNELHRTLTATSLTALGVGAVVGAGIFVVTGQAAATAAGPALVISFILSAISCFFSGICYAELSAAIPISGSAYTFTYIAVGEVAAWMVAVCLTLEYLIATAAVSVGWSGSVQAFLGEFDIEFPPALAEAPLTITESGGIGLSGSLVNFPSVIINVTITVVLCLGVKESTTFNNVFVGVKLAVLAVFICYGVYFASANPDTFGANLTPFIPENTGAFGHFGVSGIFRGAGMVFFSYVGFDSVCAMAQECKNPSRDLPRGLLLTLLICTLLYMVVTVVLTGLVKYTELAVDDPVPHALGLINAPPMIRYAVDIGAISGLTSVCLVCLMSMPRLLYSVSTDGLVPKVFGKVHKKYRTPFVSTILCGSFTTLVGGLLPLDVLAELVSVGTLMAFMLVCYSVIALRRRHPTYPRPFRVPLVPYFPLVGILLCGLQMVLLPVRTLVYYGILQCAMLVAYFCYGRVHSVAKQKLETRKSGHVSPCLSPTRSSPHKALSRVTSDPSFSRKSAESSHDEFTDYDSEAERANDEFGLHRTLSTEGSPTRRAHRMKGEERRRHTHLIVSETLDTALDTAQ